MKIIGKSKLDDFGRKHADARSQLSSWFFEVEAASWQTPIDIKSRYPQASFLGDKRVIFNIKGNSYRIETKVAYKYHTVFILRVATHAEYDKWS